MDRAPCYLDNGATSGLDPRVLEAMSPHLGPRGGNPSSLHVAGRGARSAVDAARADVAALINADPDEIVFTGSGTESDNLALRGVMARAARPRLAVSAIEHPAVLETAAALGRAGVPVTTLPVDADGVVDVDAAAAGLAAGDVALLSVMAANNVAGTLQPVAALAGVAHRAGALFHTDAVQAAGRVPLDVRAADVDLLSLSAHKFHGPQGVGALFVRRGVELEPLVYGGGQERGLRSATENVAGIVGLGAAAAIARANLREEGARLVRLRERLIEGVLATVPGAYLVGPRWNRLPGHACFGFAGLEGDAVRLLLALDERGFAVASGSACSAHHAGAPSHVLTAMGFDPIAARGSLRVTLGRFNDDHDVDDFLAALRPALAELRPFTALRGDTR
jgi:cysteine desulfurase